MSTDTTPLVVKHDDPADDWPTAGPPAVLGDRLPSPAALREELTLQVRRYVTEQRTARGAEVVPQDCFPLGRTLAAGADHLKHYGRVIRDLEREVRAHAEDEAAEIAGDATDSTPTTASWKGDVVPAANVVIPTEGGDWHIKREWESDVWADLDTLVGVQARLTAAHALAGQVAGFDGLDAFEDDEHERREAETYALCMRAAEDALHRVLFLHRTPEPKVTALKAWGTELARKGLDDLASLVAGAWKQTRRYRGVSVARD